MPTGPLVDVLVPVRNGAATVREAVESILGQTLTALRVIIVDDGSTDATPDILASLAREDPRVVVLSGPHEGVVGALNTGLERSTAEFMARQDADDVAYPERLARQIAYLRENAGCVAVGGQLRHVDEAGHSTDVLTDYECPGLADPAWVPAREPYLPGPCLLVRRTAIDAVGPFRTMHVAEDSDLCWRLQEVGGLHNLDEVLCDYRVHPESVSSQSIRHGRIMAVCSQLVALSARRRRSGKPDLPFSRAFMAEQDRLSSLADLVQSADAWLDDEERRWLRVAAGAKLVELAGYRPFELTTDDCRFVALATECGRDLLSPDNQAVYARRLFLTAIRLTAGGRPADAARLVPGKQYAAVALRAAFRRGLPASVRERVKALARRQAPAC